LIAGCYRFLRLEDRLLDDLRLDDLGVEDLRLEDLRLPLLELFRVPDRLRLPFVSPDWERCLLTVAAAICFARLELRPCLRADSLMCSY
jgi:hypothetical protein